MHRNFPAAVVYALLASQAVSACLWDYDTLLMERRKFPGVVEMISGKFLRHSPEFYAWRIKDRTEKLKTDPSRLDWYDDLAVAYSKTGDQKKAIEIIEQKDKLKPGLYETEANWGTFLLFDGQWEEALKHVRKALEINPNAHFGREKYQALLIEYVIPRLKDGKPQFPLGSRALPISKKNNHGGAQSLLRGQTFEEFLSLKLGERYDRKEAVTAVLGMMHFADYRSPLLLEPLGSLMSVQYQSGELQLTARAYLRAAEGVDDPNAKDAYLQAADAILEKQTNATLPTVQAGLKEEIAEADAWYAELREAELSWIRDGKDADAEFSLRYPAEPETTIPLSQRIDELLGEIEGRPGLIALGVLFTFVAALIVFFWWLVRRRRAQSAAV